MFLLLYTFISDYISCISVFKEIINDLIIDSKRNEKEFMVIVGDDITIKIIGSCCKINHINEAGFGGLLVHETINIYLVC